MARSIQSPGVEITEKDLSLSPSIPAGTNIFMAGFAAKGPTDEILQVTSVQELEQVYGTPTNSAERYFYHSARQILSVPAGTLYTTRLPYGEGTGEGYGSKYGALVYPVVVAEKKTTKVYRLYDVDKSVFTIPTSLTGLLLPDPTVPTVSKLMIDFDGDLNSITVTDLNSSTDLVTNGIVAGTRKIGFSDGSLLELAVKNLRDNLQDATYYTSGSLPTGAALTDLNEWVDDLNTLYTRIKDYWLSDDIEVHQNLNVDLENDKCTYVLGAPKFFELTIDEYQSVVDRSAFSGGDWSSSAKGVNEINGVSDFGSAGLIILNKIQSTINGRWEGHYLGLIDNTNLQPSTNHDTIGGIYTNITELGTLGAPASALTPVVDTKLAFKVSDSSNRGGTKSLSETLENLSFQFSDLVENTFDDVLGFGLFKLRTSPYAPTSVQLDYFTEEYYVASLDFHRQINSITGGLPRSFYLDNVASQSNNVVIMTNSYVNGKNQGPWTDAQNIPKKKVRVIGNSLVNRLSASSNAIAARVGFTTQEVDLIRQKLIQSSSTVVLAASGLKYANADYVFPIGVYSSLSNSKKTIGALDYKLDRVLRKIENEELFDVSLVLDAGLTTVYTASRLNAENNLGVIDESKSFFDDDQMSTTFKSELAALAGDSFTSNKVTDYYRTIFNKFDGFCSSLRKDCMFIADPLRHIFVTGSNSKTLDDKTKTFSSHVYNPLKNLFAAANSSYVCTYANWVKVSDPFSSTRVWVPFSAWAAADMAAMDQNFQPWYAPAGFTRGKVTNVLDIALMPKQKERDSLYKIAVNPVAFFPGDGFNIFGQKTMLRQPSAFDRINVRRLFIFLQKATKRTTRYFVFEPNTAFTRSRLVNTLKPIFDIARNDSGINEYEIVCDDRNNTPSVVDQNELVVDIYIKPVRTSEFILVNFYATSTATSFSELIGG